MPTFPRLVSDVITKARDRYADCSGTKALDYFLIAWRNLADAGDLRYKQQTITLTAGTREYAIPDDVIDISQVYYMPASSPSTWIPLYRRSLDGLDDDRWGWRQNTDQGTPFEFYTQSAVGSVNAQLSRAMIGLIPIPPTTSVAGYPCIGIFGQAVTDLATTDTLPAFTSTDSYFVASICRQYAEEVDTISQVEFWMDIEAKERGKLLVHMAKLGGYEGVRLEPRWASRMTRAK